MLGVEPRHDVERVLEIRFNCPSPNDREVAFRKRLITDVMCRGTREFEVMKRAAGYVTNIWRIFNIDKDRFHFLFRISGSQKLSVGVGESIPPDGQLVLGISEEGVTILLVFVEFFACYHPADDD